MNPLIKKLEERLPQVEHDLAEAKRLCDAPSVIKLTRLRNNTSILLALLKAEKDKRLGDAEIGLTVSLHEK
jgi:hypothetical protein